MQTSASHEAQPASGSDQRAGIVASLHDLADGILGSVRDRMELLAIELHEEKHRMVRSFVWVAAFVFTAMLAVLFISASVIVAVWDTAARLPVVVGFAVLYVGLAAWAGWRVRKTLDQPTPFTTMIDTLEEDRRCVSRKN